MTVRPWASAIRRPDSAAAVLQPVITRIVGPDLPVSIRCWDGSEFGPAHPDLRLTFRRRRALRRLVWEPNELGLARAYASGDLDLEGDLLTGLRSLQHLAVLADASTPGDPHTRRRALLCALRLGALGPPPRPPAEEVAAEGHRHTRARDARVIAHHYDLGNDFYRLLLGDSMTYSCAYWPEHDSSLAATAPDPATRSPLTHEDPDVDGEFGAAGSALTNAQTAKFDLIAGKLGLAPGGRLLDVGCGWGSFALHAARHYQVHVVGVTLSREQARYAQARVSEAHLDGRVEIRHQDYRDVADGPYDAIASIGMAEHVGSDQLPTYAAALHRLLRPRGRLLNQAIARRPDAVTRTRSHSFIDRYVFPDGELVPVATMIATLESAGFEVRDVQALREHYSLTLHAWVRNLEANWADATDLVGLARARIWRLYMAGSAVAFDTNRIGINQILAVKPDDEGCSGLPRRRAP